jgi:ATP-dependent Clp protease ATP-binding subunit ClpX
MPKKNNNDNTDDTKKSVKKTVAKTSSNKKATAAAKKPSKKPAKCANEDVNVEDEIDSKMESDFCKAILTNKKETDTSSKSKAKTSSKTAKKSSKKSSKVEDEETAEDEQCCAFCGKLRSEVKKLIISSDNVAICNECVDLCRDIIDTSIEEDEDENKEITSIDSVPKPTKIKEYLDQYVIGQEKAKKIVSVAVYNHYKRALFNDKIDKEVEEGKKTDKCKIEKSNILMLGPTGSGKTHIWRAIARMLDVPFVVADATSMTSAGYIGQDVESMLTSALKAADYDIERAEHSIILIDEIDKIRKSSGAEASGTKDVSGEAVQQGLLKIIEGSVVDVPASGKRSIHQETVKMDTSNILFCLAGSFAGIEKIIESRLNKKEIGFGKVATSSTVDNCFENILPEDLISFGLIPEIIGRAPVIAALRELKEQDLINILTMPKDAIVKQYQELFSIDNVKLEFAQDALKEIARLAMARKSGARGLKSLIESILTPIMFDIPEKDDIDTVVITKSDIAKA